jgi:hypothetical protein
MIKPLGDWTLGEVKTYCAGDSKKCKCCPFFRPIKEECVLQNTSPDLWELSNAYGFTDEEVRYANQLIVLLNVSPKAIVVRELSFDLCIQDGYNYIPLSWDLFPSVSGDSPVKLYKIAGRESEC